MMKLFMLVISVLYMGVEWSVLYMGCGEEGTGVSLGWVYFFLDDHYLEN